MRPSNHELQLFSLLRVMLKNRDVYRPIPADVIKAFKVILLWLGEKYPQELSTPNKGE